MTVQTLMLFGAVAGSALGCQAPSEPLPEPIPEVREPALPEIPVRHQTRYATVAFSGDEHPICGGTLQRIDSHVERIAEILDVEPEPIEVYWYELGDDGDDGCPLCYFAPFAIATNYDSLLHELNHAMSIPYFGRSAKIFEEGVAHAFSGKTLNSPPASILESFERGRPSGYFSRWLIETEGAEAYMAATFGSPRPSDNELLERIEEVYGRPLEQLGDEFSATAPAWYGPIGTCDGLERFPWPEGSTTFSYETVADCESPAAFGHTGDDDAPFLMSFVLEVPTELIGQKFVTTRVEPSHGNLALMFPCDIGEGPPGEFVSRPSPSTMAVSPSFVSELQTTSYRVELPYLVDGETVAMTIETQDPQ